MRALLVQWKTLYLAHSHRSHPQEMSELLSSIDGDRKEETTMKREGSWFQGWSTCTGGIYLNAVETVAENSGGCLWMAAQTMEEIHTLAAIVRRLFPERACLCRGGDSIALIHFNNHPDTTFDHVEKILHTYELEHGA